MKHHPFNSIYRPDFEVVEERQGKLRFYPHNEQLPLIWRALNLEFRGALPNRIARVTARSDGYHKILLNTAALMFCTQINGSRSDGIRLFPLPDPDLVTRVAIAQQVTEVTPRGHCHFFRFYAGADFVREIHLSGKRVRFAEHVMERFSSRVPNNVGEDMTMLLLAFFGSPIVSTQVGGGRAFILNHQNSVLAFTFKETEAEYFITTCLGIHQINSMGLEMPPQAFNAHYGTEFAPPQIRNWFPGKFMLDCYELWQNKKPLAEPVEWTRNMNWYRLASRIRDLVHAEGFVPGSRMVFVDHIPGPWTLNVRPDQTELRYDERVVFKEAYPAEDWDTWVAARDANARRMTPRVEH